MDASGGEGRDQGHYLVGTVILGFLSFFKKCHASSPFEALILRAFDVPRNNRPPLKMRLGPRASLGSPQGIQTSPHLVT